MWYPAELVPFLLVAASTRKHLSLRNCSRESSSGFGQWDSGWASRSGEGRIGDLLALSNVVSLTLQTSYIFGHGLDGEVGALCKEISKSLESFSFFCGKQVFPRVSEEIDQGSERGAGGRIGA